jgi:2-oxoglutarate dehydrogenase E2 component (dihydrolipoamide succinyltransferase)
MGTPILNPPQTAILGMHGIFKRPVVLGDSDTVVRFSFLLSSLPPSFDHVLDRDCCLQVVRPMMYVALTYDHRIIDGGTAVQFLRKIKDCVEDPARMLLDI